VVFFGFVNLLHVTNSQEPEISRTDDKVVQEKFDTHIKSSQEKSPDDLENSDNTKETKTHGQLPGSDIFFNNFSIVF
jgi:hypothetical protein